MLRIGSMNMLLHGAENPEVRYRDSLAQADDDDAEKYSLILANPPFAGSLDYESTAKDLQQIVKTKKTELLFLALFLRFLQTGGRAAVIVPDGVLFGSTKAHRTLRTILVEEQKLDAVISMPSGVFKPYAGVSTAILLFTKTNSGGTDLVWFYDMQEDGYSLDDKRMPQPQKSDLGDILARWQNREAERKRARTDQSFMVPKAEITDKGYDLSISRYKEVEYEAIEHDPPRVILERLAELEAEIAQGRVELQGMLGWNWPISTIGEVCTVVSGATPKTGNPDYWDGDIPWVTPKDLSELSQKYLSDTSRKITGPGLQSCSARMLPAHSVLFSSRAPHRLGRDEHAAGLYQPGIQEHGSTGRLHSPRLPLLVVEDPSRSARTQGTRGDFQRGFQEDR